MKMYKFLLALITIIGLTKQVHSQSCYKPMPMTQQQMKLVLGQWNGNYSYAKKQQKMAIAISIKDNQLVCEITNPPLSGKESSQEYSFCPSGEFHFKKYIGAMYYEFHGIPESGHITGTLVIHTNENDTGYGEFALDKITKR